MTQWAPFVRQHVLLFDLIAALHFETNDKVAGLQHRSPATNDAPPRLYPIAAMCRPSSDVFKAAGATRSKSGPNCAKSAPAKSSAQLTPQFAYWNAVANLQLDQRPKTLELIGLALSLASFVEMRFKHALACARPADYSPTSSRSSHPAARQPAERPCDRSLHGRAPARAAVAAWRAHRHQLQRLAARTSINRTVAGVHFPVDSLAGQLLGQTLGEYLVWTPPPVHDPLRRTCLRPAADHWRSRIFEHHRLQRRLRLPAGAGGQEGRGQELPPSSGQTEPSTALGWLWDQAWDEWIRS